MKLDRKILGKRIREERLRLKLTQEQLSEKIDVTASYLGSVERGEKSMTLEKLIDLINVFGVSMDYILSDFMCHDSGKTEDLTSVVDSLTPRQQKLALEIVKLIRDSF